jgi:two-component sensor histidine kinase
VLSLALHHLSLSGVSSYLLPFPSTFVTTEAYFSVYYAVFIAITTVFFTREFLRTKRYPIVDRLLLASLVPPLLIAVFSTKEHYLLHYIIYYGTFMIFLFESIGFYAWKKGEPKAKYYLIGWTASLSGILMLILYHTGLIHFYIPYYFEATVVFEVLFFAVIIAWEYSRVKDEKFLLMDRLSKIQERQVEELNRLVGERTEALEKSLTNYRILLKELNHRVKNNLQMIVSLLHLQSDEANTAGKEEALRDMESRILAISEVYEMLYREENFSSVEAKRYIEKLAHHIRMLYPQGERVSLDIESDAILPMHQAVYCGIVLVELITNTLKHALFPETGGRIKISLTRVGNGYHLTFSDNGQDVEFSSNREGLGMTIVETIVRSQLKGDIVWRTRPMLGVEYAISFPSYEDGSRSR